MGLVSSYNVRVLSHPSDNAARKLFIERVANGNARGYTKRASSVSQTRFEYDDAVVYVEDMDYYASSPAQADDIVFVDLSRDGHRSADIMSWASKIRGDGCIWAYVGDTLAHNSTCAVRPRTGHVDKSLCLCKNHQTHSEIWAQYVKAKYGIKSRLPKVAFR